MRTTFRGMHATEKPQCETCAGFLDSSKETQTCPNCGNDAYHKDGDVIAQEGVTETSTGSYAVCDCGRVAEVVSHSEVITRVKCECATADTGCKVLAA